MPRLHLDSLQPVVKSSAISVLPPGLFFDRAWFDDAIVDFDIWFTIGGAGEYLAKNGGRYQSRRGTCALLRPGNVIGSRTVESMSITAWVHFDLMDSSGTLVPPSEVAATPLIGELAAPHSIETILRRIVMLRNSPGFDALNSKSGAAAEASCLLKAVLHAFIASLTPGGGLEEQISSHQRAMQSALSWLHSHPDKRIEVAELARKYGYGLKHFARLFKQHTGVSPNTAIINARVDYARQLLADARLTVSQVADALGYSDVSYFSKQFKEYTGLSPLEFRHKSRARSEKKSRSSPEA